MHRAFARWLSVAFDYLDLRLVDVRQHLGQAAHVEQRPADRTVPEMICFSFGRGALNVPANDAFRCELPSHALLNAGSYCRRCFRGT
jgi:hypothetical protein